MTDVRVIVTGPVGCGKSAVAGEIEIAMKAIGLPVRYADEREAQSEKNMTHADWAGYLDMYRPSVVLEERIEPKRSFPEAADGRPTTDEEALLFGAGCDPATARFVAQQLRHQGISLVRTELLERTVQAMERVTVFVTSRERIKRPEGEDLWQESIAAVRSALPTEGF